MTTSDFQHKYPYKFELENFNDSEGRYDCTLEYALTELTDNGLIYATTEYIDDERLRICVVAANRSEINGKTIDEIKTLFNKKVNERRFPPNRPLEKLADYKKEK